MISLHKLATLADGTRMRKTVSLIADFERDELSGRGIDSVYLKGLLLSAAGDEGWPADIRKSAKLLALQPNPGTDDYLRALNSLRHRMLGALGRDWADWDMEAPGDDAASETAPEDPWRVHPCRVYLDGLRSPFNVGSIMRTSLAFGVEKIWSSSDGASPDHRRAIRSSMGAAERLDWSVRDLAELDESETGTVFALELGGTGISDFHFPPSGTVIIGSEELGVSPGAMNRAEMDGGVVTIPLPGPKASINVGVAFGILLRQWVVSIS